jgi:hypothetical protein
MPDHSFSGQLAQSTKLCALVTARVAPYAFVDRKYGAGANENSAQHKGRRARTDVHIVNVNVNAEAECQKKP